MIPSTFNSIHRIPYISAVYNTGISDALLDRVRPSAHKPGWLGLLAHGRYVCRSFISRVACSDVTPINADQAITKF